MTVERLFTSVTALPAIILCGGGGGRGARRGGGGARRRGPLSLRRRARGRGVPVPLCRGSGHRPARAAPAGRGARPPPPGRPRGAEPAGTAGGRRERTPPAACRKCQGPQAPAFLQRAASAAG
ncbi:unnamed protein product [Coccothraustes coccothraustes]